MEAIKITKIVISYMFLVVSLRIDSPLMCSGIFVIKLRPKLLKSKLLTYAEVNFRSKKFLDDLKKGHKILMSNMLLFVANLHVIFQTYRTSALEKATSYYKNRILKMKSPFLQGIGKDILGSKRPMDMVDGEFEI